LQKKVKKKTCRCPPGDEKRRGMTLKKTHGRYSQEKGGSRMIRE